MMRTLSVCALTTLACLSADGFHVNVGHKSKTSLKMIKGNDRARLEKRLEDLLDNDWRVFRARLVAQEQQRPAVMEKSSPEEIQKEELPQQSSDLGEMFSHALSQIFPGKQAAVKSLRRGATAAGEGTNNEHSIFDGTDIGNAKSSFGDLAFEDFAVGDLTVEDPFVSHAELPSFLPPSSVHLDKHRWAHSIPFIEPGCVMVANEKLGGVFHQTVVLVIEHSESQGTTGVIINRPLSSDLRHIADTQNTTLDLSLKIAFSQSPVTYGGPVNTDNFSILHGYGEVEGSRKLAPGVFVGGSEELMNEVHMGRLDPQDTLFIKGHAAWAAGHLSREIEKGVWYPAAICGDFILRYASSKPDEEASDLWADVLTCLGSQYAEIAQKHAGRGDRRMMP